MLHLKLASLKIFLGDIHIYRGLGHDWKPTVEV